MLLKYSLFVLWIVCLRVYIVGCTCDPVYPDPENQDGALVPDGLLPDGDQPDHPVSALKDGAVEGAPDGSTATHPYRPCPCPAESTCLTSGCETCAPNCFSLADCPPGPDGTAQPECLPQGGGPEGVCLLVCGTLGTCPSGMECDLDFSPFPACMSACPSK